MALTVSDILGTIRDNANNMYMERVPEYTRDNLGQVGKAITSDENIMNNFVTSLVNRIALVHIKSKLFNNPLSRLKGSGVPYGNTIQELFINPATDVGYDTDGTKLLKTTKPDGKVCYYGLNRQSSYPVSIAENELQRAFTNEQEFMSFYDGIVNSMMSGDQIDEFMLTKGVIAKAIDEGAITVIESSTDDPKLLSKAISNISKQFAFPNTAFAGYNNVNNVNIANGEKACITFCDTNRQALIVRADAQTEIDYEVLATMFHMEVAKLEAITILVDTIPCENYDIYAVLCDVDAVQIRDMTFKTTNQYIGSSLMWNFWLHHWQYLFVSMFGNMVAFGKAKVPVTSLKITGNATINSIGGTSQLSIGYTPTNPSMKKVRWSIDDNKKATINESGLVTAKAIGKVNITATSIDGTGVKDTFEITISNS